MFRLRTGVLLIIAALAVACGDDGESAQPTATAPVPTTPTSSGPAVLPPTTGPATSTPADCRETANWTTGGEQSDTMSPDVLYQVRIGRHDCYDRLTFDIRGTAEVGYVARYVPVVTADGSGQPLPVAGKAALEVVIRAPGTTFDEAGQQSGPVLAKTGDYLYAEKDLAGWSSLRAVRFAGFFEGQCTFAVGVRDTLPFRLFTTLDKENRIQHVVVDIAH